MAVISVTRMSRFTPAVLGIIVSIAVFAGGGSGVQAAKRGNAGDVAAAAADCNQFEDPTRQAKGCSIFIRSGVLQPEMLSIAYTNRGIANVALGKIERGLADFNEAIKLDDSNPLPFYNRGNVEFDLGQFDNALKDFDASIARDGEFALAYYNRGVVHERLGALEKGIEDYKKALSLDPELDAARERLQDLGVQPGIESQETGTRRPT